MKEDGVLKFPAMKLHEIKHENCFLDQKLLWKGNNSLNISHKQREIQTENAPSDTLEQGVIKSSYRTKDGAFHAKARRKLVKTYLKATYT